MIKLLKKKFINNMFSQTELDNFMDSEGFRLIENDNDDVLKYTNDNYQIWIYGAFDGVDILVNEIKKVTKQKDVETKVDPFHTFEDLEKVQEWFMKNKKYHHWLAGWLQASLGRRVGDVMKLKWSDIFNIDGTYKHRLNTLKEEKTGKIVGARLIPFATQCIDRYIDITGEDPVNNYNDKIFCVGSASFRAALKNAVRDVGIIYPVSCHSYRKYYGNMLYKLHPQDAENLNLIQMIFGHSSQDITKNYINHINERIDGYTNDLSDYFCSMINGNDYVIDNCSVVTLRTNDIRDIIIESLKMESSIDNLNLLLKKIEEMKL